MAEPTETTPLLGSEIEVLINEAAYQNQQLQPEPEPEPEPEPQDSSIPAREHFKRPVKIITALILITSIIDLIFAIASEVVIDSGHFDAGAGYYTSDGLVLLGFFVFLAWPLSALNLRYKIPIVLNVVLDIVLAWAIIGLASELVGGKWPGYGWCGRYDRPATDDCKRWKLALQVLIGFVAAFGGVVGASHLVLFVLRVVAIFRTKFWRRAWGLSFPTGEISIAVTIKVLKQQPPVETPSPAGPGIGLTTA